MINYKEEKITETKKILKSITCDKCGEDYTDTLEVQEFHRIQFVGGYASVFGDETKIEADICQHCLYKYIENFCRTLEV